MRMMEFRIETSFSVLITTWFGTKTISSVRLTTRLTVSAWTFVCLRAYFHLWIRYLVNVISILRIPKLLSLFEILLVPSIPLTCSLNKFFFLRFVNVFCWFRFFFISITWRWPSWCLYRFSMNFFRTACTWHIKAWRLVKRLSHISTVDSPWGLLW